MAPRLFERLSAAFWGYISPQQVAAQRRNTTTRTARPSSVPSPIKVVTPQRPGNSYALLTPADTNTGSKRKRAAEVEDYNKKTKFDVKHAEDEAEEVCLEEMKLEYMARVANTNQYELDGPFSEGDDYDSRDEDEEEGADYDYNVYNPIIDSRRSVEQSFDYEDEEDDGIVYDYNTYNPTIRTDRPRAPSKPLLESPMPSGIPKITIDSVEDSEDEDMITVLPRQHTPRYGPNDEDLIVFADDTDASDNNALDTDNDHLDASSLIPSHSDHSLYNSFFEEAQEEGDTILLDSRARVGSLEDERVSKDQLLQRGWPEPTVPLIQRIHNRGREPLFTHTWRMDFPMMPEGMFLPPHHAHPGFINSLQQKVATHEFRAKKAFNELMQLGPKVRDLLLVGKLPESLIVKEIAKYIQWSEWDTNNQHEEWNFIELHAGTKDTDVADLQDSLLSRLSTLHTAWATSPSAPRRPSIPIHQQQPPPPLYGILVSHTLVGIVAYMPPGEESDSIGYLRTVGVFDFNVLGYDVWTCLALALLVLHVRDLGVRRGCSRRTEGVRDRWRQRKGSGDPDR
ncbi:hypothetical protein E4T47_03230 [Aureobasidium subglaciale]|nr:hypothetical protein E4T47_03230 [Aureobasidium subglaciale]